MGPNNLLEEKFLFDCESEESNQKNLRSERRERMMRKEEDKHCFERHDIADIGVNRKVKFVVTQIPWFWFVNGLKRRRLRMKPREGKRD